MRSPIKISCLAAAALLLVGNGAAAQEAPPLDSVKAAPSKVESRLGLDLLTGSIESATASQQGTGSRAWGFLVNGGVTAFRILDLSADVGVVDVSDKDAFSENTTAGVKTSSVSAFLGTVAVGLRTPPLDLGDEDTPATLSAGVNLGHTWLSAERSIVNCVDCTEEDLEIRAGSFWEPGLHVTPGGRRWGISARYRIYGGASDLKDSVMIGVTGAF